MLPLALLLMAVAPHVEITDEVYQIPANDWRYVELNLNQRPALVTARYTVLSSGSAAAVRAALVARDDVRTLRSGDGLDDYDPTPAGASGEFKRHTREPGVYAVVVENRAPAPASVRIRISLDFPVATMISRERQYTVVAISFAVFFAIVAFSARRLLRFWPR
jgi:hypothetical protein